MTIKDYEIIILDTGSESDGLEQLFTKDQLQYVKIKKLNSNLGFAVANNIGARLSRGTWLALLNADAFPEPEWLENLVKAAQKNPEYRSFSSRQIQYNSPYLLDGAGDMYHVSGLAWRSCYNFPVDEKGLQQKEVFSSCAAAAMYSREDFLKFGGFDEDYFSYFEDVDFGFRLRLNGIRCLYVPDAVVFHIGSGSTGKWSNFSVYHGYRNMIWTYLKNMPYPYFWLFLPIHFFTVLFFIVYLTFRGHGKAIIRAVIDAIYMSPNMFRKRFLIQKNVTADTKDILSAMSIGVVEPFQEFLSRNLTR